MIRSISDLVLNSSYQALILGMPGDGKSTLACSTPNPLVIDTDDGINRIAAQHRPSNFIQGATYAEILDDINNADLSPYKTIVVDTLGRLLDLMTDHAKSVNSKYLQSDGTLTMKGWGWLGQEFIRFSKKLRNLNKNVVFVAHTIEEQDGENKVYRIDAGGRAKKEIMKDMDFVGFVEVSGKDLVVNWGPSERYYTKNSIGIVDYEKLPKLDKGESNSYMTDLFNRANLQRVEDGKLNDKYKSLIVMVKNELENVKNADTAMACLELLKTLDHVYQSFNEVKYWLKGKTDSLGLIYNIKSKKFEVKKK